MADLCTVDYSIGWIPTSIGITAADKQVLAAERHIDPRQLRGSYAILGSRHKHAVIKRGLALRNTLAALRDKYLLPEAVLATSAADSTATIRRARSYVIDQTSVEPFQRDYDAARDAYLAWGVELSSQETYEELRDLDRQAIGDSWPAVERLYPTQQSLRESVYCTNPVYNAVARGLDFSYLPADLQQRLRSEARERLDATTQNIEAMLLEQFQTFIEAVRRSCGNVVRVQPSTTGPWAEYADADVVSHKIVADEDTANPTCEVVLRKPGSSETQTITLQERTFREELKPTETAEYRRLTDAAFANLLESTDKIARFRNQLREADDKEFLASFAKNVELVLRDYGRSPTGIANALRDDTSKRDSLRHTFDGLLTQLQTSGTAVRARQLQSKRKIFSNLDA